MPKQVNKVPRSYICECGSAFARRGDFDRHWDSVHLRIKDFICQYCNTGFAQKAQRDIHENTHTGNKPYPCTEDPKCKRKFGDPSTRSRHEKETHNAPQFACPLCDSMVKRKTTLRTHIRNIHKVDPGTLDPKLLGPTKGPTKKARGDSEAECPIEVSGPSPASSTLTTPSSPAMSLSTSSSMTPPPASPPITVEPSANPFLNFVGNEIINQAQTVLDIGMDPYDLNLDASLIPTSTGADAEDFMKLAEPGFITYDMSSLTPETFDPSGIDDYLQSLGASLSASNPFALPGFQFIPGTTPSSNTGYTEYLFPIPSTSPGASSSTVSTSTSTLTSNTPSTTPMSRNDQHIGSLNINEPPSNGGLEARFWQPAQTPQRRDSVVVVGPQNQ